MTTDPSKYWEKVREGCEYNTCMPVAPVVYQVVVELGIGQLREFEPRRLRTRDNSSRLFLVHNSTSGQKARA